MRIFLDLYYYEDLLENEYAYSTKELLNQILDYHIVVIQQISYNRRYEYCSLLFDYLSEQMNSQKFRWEFYKMELDDALDSKVLFDDFNNLATFSIDLDKKGFINILTEITDLCNLEQVSEKSFRDQVQKYYYKIKSIASK